MTSNNISDADVSEYSNSFKKYLLYLFQGILIWGILFYYVSLFTLPTILYFIFSELPWYKCISGFYLSNSVVYFSIIASIRSIYELRSAFPFFCPFYCYIILNF